VQHRIERERKELEQGHVRIVKEFEARIRDVDNTNRVSTFMFLSNLLFVLCSAFTNQRCLLLVSDVTCPLCVRDIL